MSSYSYVALDSRGLELRGTLDVPDQDEALRRIKGMGLFPTKVLAATADKPPRAGAAPRANFFRRAASISIPGLRGRIKPATLSEFTHNLATLIQAGMPLLRGLQLLREQEENREMRRVIGEIVQGIESGNSLAETLAAHPKVFNRLYINMVRAGELGGALDVTLGRLAEFMEKAQRIKGKIKAALFYPCAVVFVAAAVVSVMIVFVIPRFKLVFDGLMNGLSMPAFTTFVFNLSEAVQRHILGITIGLAGLTGTFLLLIRTRRGRWSFDRLKLDVPVLGPVFRKAAISRFARTLGTLSGSGVPVLQALTILKETAGNVVVRQVIARVHDQVKQGEPIAPTLKASRVFPAMVAGMVDVGEQTGALPEMLTKIADKCDEDVDNAATALTSLLEPVLLVFLAIVVGSIVIAMFLPLVDIIGRGFDHTGPHDN
ncbi:MAG TPA: type II secretion system F family protein [Verrucomicrobiae bacterium]|nr:type II secretion system F family protein [Verrucomicrobiae bacterium]